MPDLQLTEDQLATIRSLLRLEPVPGHPLPHQQTFDLLAQLVPCDVLGAVFTDMAGRTISGLDVYPIGRRQSVASPSKPKPWIEDELSGPYYLGYMLWREHPAEAEGCRVELDGGDGLAIGFRNGTDHIVQYFFRRELGLFSPGELALLWLLGPALERLARERPTPHLPLSLTLTERRILSHVAAGLSNAEIAETFVIATSTVRKHLENSYRKLGVSSRAAALARMQGRDEPAIDLRERLDRYA